MFDHFNVSLLTKSINFFFFTDTQTIYYLFDFFSNGLYLQDGILLMLLQASTTSPPGGQLVMKQQQQVE